MICNFGVWEPDITAAISDMLQDGEIVVDVGANIGYYSLLCASLVGEHGRVFAIEPHPQIFALPQQNIALNGYSNIVPLNIAAGAEEGELELFSGPETSLGESTMVARRGFESIGVVKVKPLTQTIPPEYRSRIALIKIDVEGAAAPILRELMDNIEHDPTGMKILVEMANDQSEREALFDRMKSLGFNAYAIPNDYDDSYYLTWTKPIVPRKIDTLPAEQIDVIFSRGALGTRSTERMR
jgi:FkbM family methyltransferase